MHWPSIRRSFGRRRPALRLRSYEDGCERAIVNLWNEAHTGLAGYIARSVPIWRWSILERPGVTPEDILRVEEPDGRLSAYGAIAQGGAVLDFAVRPGLPRRLRKAVGRLLLEGLEERARAQGAPALTLSVPGTSALPAEVLLGEGFREVEREHMSLSIVHPERLLETILTARGREVQPFTAERILLRIEKGAYRADVGGELGIDWTPTPPHEEGDVELRLRRSPVGFEPTLLLDLDLPALTDLVFRRAPVDALTSSGSIRCSPAEAAPRATAFLALLVLRTPWHLPTADVL